MALSDDQMGDRAASELSVLSGVIDYADDMFYQQKKSEYESLRRHAYGKTVVIETEKQGELTFRLSSTPVIYPNFASGYATPYSPVGRLCSYLKPGDEDETPRWGEYRVREVRLFDRYDGPRFEPNVRNFLNMAVDGDKGKAKITNLRDYLGRLKQKSTRPQITPPLFLEKVFTEATPTEIHAVKLEPAALDLNIETFAVVEDDDEELGTPVVLEEDEPSEANTQAEEIYFGLSESFYTNRTRDQDAVIARSPFGPMFVEGVAGSGKTSAALGRTKMLCEFNAANILDEAEFRAIAGDKLEYWSGDFAGQFSQESSIGFVRTGELIQYLKETCRRLDLPNLPVCEYPELRSNLRVSRKVDRHRHGSHRWGGLGQSRGTHTDTTMAWLHAADRALASVMADFLETNIPTAEALASDFDDSVRPVILRVANVAIQRLRTAILQVSRTLLSPRGNKEFALDRLAARIDKEIRTISQSVLDRQMLWLFLGDQTLTATTESDLARQLLAEKVPLYTKASARLVFANEMGPIDSTLTLVSKAGEVVQWRAEMRELMAKGEILVRDAVGRTMHAQVHDQDILFLSLHPEATSPPYVLSDKGLKKIKIIRGLGRSQYPLKPKMILGEVDQTEKKGQEATQQPAAATPLPQQRTVNTVFNTKAKETLLKPLVSIADFYAQALHQQPTGFPDLSLASTIGRQLAQDQLAEEDIDLLLCLANNIGRGFNGSPNELRQPSYYQAVFIDEVQDFTEQQVYLMAEQARPEYQAITVVGDLAQKLHNGSIIDVPACFPATKVPVIQLMENMRQLDAPGLAWFSACFRAEFQDGLIGHQPSPLLASRLRENANKLGGPMFKRIEDDEHLVEELVRFLHNLNPYYTAAVILPDAGMAVTLFELCNTPLRKQLIEAELSQKIDLSRRHVRHFTTVAQAKGLEFDVVLVPYLEHYDLNEQSQINALYVALTRPRQQLVLFSHRSRTHSRFDQLYSWYEDTLVNVCAPTIS